MNVQEEIRRTLKALHKKGITYKAFAMAADVNVDVIYSLTSIHKVSDETA